MHNAIFFSLPLLLAYSMMNFIRAGDVCLDLSTQEIAYKINMFGVDFLKTLYKNATAEENVLVSPVNTYTTLALLHLGAGKTIRNRLANVMKLSSGLGTCDEMHQDLKVALSVLPWHRYPPKHHEMKLMSAIFLRDDFRLKPSYLVSLEHYYQYVGQAKNVNFEHSSEITTDFLNSWISNYTDGRFAKFYDEPLAINTTAIVLNVALFDGLWYHGFVNSSTKNMTFNTGSAEIQTPTMSVTDIMRKSVVSDEYEVITFPFARYDYEMNIYMRVPNYNGKASLVDLFDEIVRTNLTVNVGQHTSLNIRLPKIKFSRNISMSEVLQLEELFGEVDMPEMVSLKHLKWSMIHLTGLQVAEDGVGETKNLTRTHIDVVEDPPMPWNWEPHDFFVNRPFLVTIKHTTTQLIVLVGIIRTPIE